jgi:hypothetical protein
MHQKWNTYVQLEPDTTVGEIWGRNYEIYSHYTHTTIYLGFCGTVW